MSLIPIINNQGKETFSKNLAPYPKTAYPYPMKPSPYDLAIMNKNAAKSRQRDLIAKGKLSPAKAQEINSLFHGVQSRVISHGKGSKHGI